MEGETEGVWGGEQGRCPCFFVLVEEAFLPEAEVVAVAADDDVVEQFDADDVG